MYPDKDLSDVSHAISERISEHSCHSYADLQTKSVQMSISPQTRLLAFPDLERMWRFYT